MKLSASSGGGGGGGVAFADSFLHAVDFMSVSWRNKKERERIRERERERVRERARREERGRAEKRDVNINKKTRSSVFTPK